MRIIFAGTPEFAAEHLTAILQSNHPELEVVAVYTQPDRPAGRGRKLQFSPVKELAVVHNIPVEQPANFKLENDLHTLKQHQADIMVVVAYGILLPKVVLDTPKYGCINVHASLLPRWRGAAPYHRAILAGDKETGVTIMQMDEGLDTGAMLNTVRCPILDTDCAADLHDRLIEIGQPALIDSLLCFAKHGVIAGEAQNDQQANYAHKLKKQEGAINWQRPAFEVLRHIRALNPWPVAFSHLQGQAIRIWQAKTSELVCADSVAAGEIVQIKGKLLVNTADRAIEITQLQGAGAKKMAAVDFINGKGQWVTTGLVFDESE